MSIAQQCIASGLFSVGDEGFFSRCDHCNQHNTVYACDGFTSLANAQSGSEPEQFKVCGDCLNTLYYGKDGAQ
jgi:hypothetical protein